MSMYLSTQQRGGASLEPDETGGGAARPRRVSSSAGFTLVEVSIIVIALSILSAILLPQLGVYIRDARLARAREDVAAIGVSMMQMLKDTGESAFYRHGQSGDNTPGRDFRSDPVGLLIGDGDVPDEGPSGSDDWRASIFDNVRGKSTDFGGFRQDELIVDTFTNQLIENFPGDKRSSGPGFTNQRYRVPQDMGRGRNSSGVDDGLYFDPGGGHGFNSEFAWRGPYLDAVRPDPWGNRYMSNVQFLTMPATDTVNDATGFNRPVIVISAGPDEQIDTKFGNPIGLSIRDDDIAYPIAYGTLR